MTTANAPFWTGSTAIGAASHDSIGPLVDLGVKKAGKKKKKGFRKKQQKHTDLTDLADDGTGDVRMSCVLLRLPLSAVCLNCLCLFSLFVQTIGDDASSYSSIQGLTFEEEAQCQKCGCNLLANCNFCQNCGHRVIIDGAFASRKTYED